MAPRTWITTLAFVAVAATPAFAQDGHHRRATQDREQPRQEQPAQQPQQAAPPQTRDRAVPRTVEPRRDQQVRQDQVRRDDQARRQDQGRRESNGGQYNSDQGRRGSNGGQYNDDQGRRESNGGQYNSDQGRRGSNGGQYNGDQGRREYNGGYYSGGRTYDARRDDGRRYNGGGYGRYEGRPSYSRGYAPRIIRPTIIQVVPYRPYVYRPSWSIGVFYGSGGYYPYGATPRGYYDPIPGRYYGGVRITGAPRDARVFADGYYVGIVDDFDGIFQHINLEAGPHHIEIEEPGLEPIAFDVYVRPGETTTFRADDAYFRE
ncbi:MAG TPA: PEGA domain-containing protein [Vicinamibacterales bacterium]|nr:PEGA domain-containing protein [Vicinamibacterales bacterium]